MGRVTIVVDVIGQKVKSQTKLGPASIQELSTAAMYLELARDAIKNQIIKMSKWGVEKNE